MTGCNSASGPLNAAGDIVGYGILAAFFGSALVTIAAVLLAYYHDAIDDDLMTDLDHQFRIEIRPIMREAKECVKRLIRGLLKRVFRQAAELSTAQSNTQHRGDLRKRRTACFNQFVLSLSDQQLVTGLALLIITVSSQNHLSGYEFSVAHSLAWFSSTTHLATLYVLRPTLKRQNRYILAIRVLGVLSVLVLLTYTSYRVSLEMSESKLPVSCTNRQVEVDTIMVDELAQTTLVLLVIWGGYICRLLDICLKDEFDLWAWASRAQLEYPEPRSLNLSQRRAKALANRRCNKLLRLRELEENQSFFSPFYAIECKMTMGGFSYNRSFISTIPMISFSFSYGVCQVVLYAFIHAPELTEEAREMGFGQLMALLLLLIPCLAAGEVYSDYQNEKVVVNSVVVETDTVQEQQSQPARHLYEYYDEDFEIIKKYFFTAVDDPSEIPEARKSFLYQECSKLTEIEYRLIRRGWSLRTVCFFVIFHTAFGIVLAVLLVISSHPLVYAAAFAFFVLWMLFTIPDFLTVVKMLFERSPAQRIYVETEFLVQERQRML